MRSDSQSARSPRSDREVGVDFVVFGVNIGDRGRSGPEGRPTSAELCRRLWNEAFRLDGTPFTAAYRVTGNFFLNSGDERSVGQIADALCATAKRTFAVEHGQTVGAFDQLEVPELVNAMVDRFLDLTFNRRSGGSP